MIIDKEAKVISTIDQSVICNNSTMKEDKNNN